MQIAELKISIIIPIYNHENYVVECLKSIVEQRDYNFEIIAIDDGSTDSSYNYAYTYLKNNLDGTNWKISKRENKGINKTVNEAIQCSSGEIIYILASDDRMPLDSLTKIRQAYSDEIDSCKLFFYDVALISWDGELVNSSASSLRHGGAVLLSSSKLHLASQLILNWGCPFEHQFYSREYYNKFGPYPEELKYEDLYFALKAISNDCFYFVPYVLKEYRLRKNQTRTPGINDIDLNQSIVRKTVNPMISSKYKFLFYISSRCDELNSGFIKYMFDKACVLIKRGVYYWSAICHEIRNRFENKRYS